MTTQEYQEEHNVGECYSDYSNNPDVPAFLKQQWLNGKLSDESFEAKAKEALEDLAYARRADEDAERARY